MMDHNTRIAALTKMAFFGSAPVSGSPFYSTPAPTVGQMMYNLNSVGTSLPGVPQYMLNMEKRKINDRLVATGRDVNSPAKSLLRAGIGALAGNFISNAIGAGPFARGVSTALGATYGYNH